MLYTYDFKKVVLTVEGIPISGYVDGTGISVDRNADSFALYSGNDGHASRSQTNDFTGTITISLAQTSPSNAVLQAFNVEDEITGEKIVSIMCKDAGPRASSIFFSALGFIRKPAKADFAKEVSAREWVIACADLVMGNNGNTPYVPGV